MSQNEIAVIVWTGKSWEIRNVEADLCEGLHYTQNSLNTHILNSCHTQPGMAIFLSLYS